MYYSSKAIEWFVAITAIPNKKAKEGIIMESGDGNNEPQQEDGQKPLCALEAMRGGFYVRTITPCLFREAGIEPLYLVMFLSNTVMCLRYADRQVKFQESASRPLSVDRNSCWWMQRRVYPFRSNA